MSHDEQPKLKSCCSVSRSSAEDVSRPSEPDGFTGMAKSGNAGKSGMVWIPGGNFLMGTDDREGFPADGEGPVHNVSISPYYMDECAVTNDDFRRFIRETGYVTEAERFGWSYVFHLFVSRAASEKVKGTPAQTPWWLAVEGADWRHPEGPDSEIERRGDHPAVHLSWNDAMAYCRWSGKRLPTEAEWEYAARGGLVQKRYPWGDELKPGGEHRCNIWQGKFPIKDHGSDGYSGTAPVRSYQPNGYGLYNMSGNVWEWCADWFSPAYYASGESDNPSGPERGSEESHARRIVFVPQLLLQPVPRGGAQQKYAGQLDGERRFPVRHFRGRLKFIYIRIDLAIAAADAIPWRPRQFFLSRLTYKTTNSEEYIPAF